jgi:hypothetical protein
MTDETYERIRDYVRRNAVPPSDIFPEGLSISVHIDHDLADDEPRLLEQPYIELHLSPGDYADLQARCQAKEATCPTR